MLNLETVNGKQVVKPFSPLYAAVFKKLVNDVKFVKEMDKMALVAGLDDIRSNVSKVEQELVLLEKAKNPGIFLNNFTFDLYIGYGVYMRKEFLDKQLQILTEKGNKIQKNMNKL